MTKLPKNMSGYLERSSCGVSTNGGVLNITTPVKANTKSIVDTVIGYINEINGSNFQIEYSKPNNLGIYIANDAKTIHTPQGIVPVSLRIEMGNPPEYEGNNVRISVHVSPSGISDNYLDDLFKKFLIDNKFCDVISDIEVIQYR